MRRVWLTTQHQTLSKAGLAPENFVCLALFSWTERLLGNGSQCPFFPNQSGAARTKKTSELKALAPLRFREITIWDLEHCFGGKDLFPSGLPAAPPCLAPAWHRAAALGWVYHCVSACQCMGWPCVDGKIISREFQRLSFSTALSPHWCGPDHLWPSSSDFLRVHPAASHEEFSISGDLAFGPGVLLGGLQFAHLRSARVPSSSCLLKPYQFLSTRFLSPPLQVLLSSLSQQTPKLMAGPAFIPEPSQLLVC